MEVGKNKRGTAVSELDITKEEWKKEIDLLANQHFTRKLTKNEIEKIDYGRKKNPPIGWQRLSLLFREIDNNHVDKKILKREYNEWLNDKEQYFNDGEI